MSLKAKLEAIIYAAESPVTLDQIVHLVQESPENDTALRSQVRTGLEELVGEYASADHGIEIRQVAGGYRMATKPEQHDVVRAFAKSLKPPIRLSLPALETLAVIAYKQPVTVPEISEIRGVDSSGVIATLLDRKLITTAGRKVVIGRPILYKTTKEFLLRFGLKDVSELPSMEEFEKLVAESFQADLYPADESSEAGAGATLEGSSPASTGNETAHEEHVETGKPNE
jgi:segregation and condensation protein B